VNKSDLSQLIEALPYNLREQIDGYVASIEAVGVEIFQESKIRYSQEALDRLLFFAGLRRLWTLLDTQYWVMDNSLTLLKQHDVSAVSLGSTDYGRNSDSFLEL
jgi:hypothetical protein